MVFKSLLMVVILIIGYVSAQRGCTPPWEDIGGSCYLFSGLLSAPSVKPLTWEGARQYCQREHSGDLATLGKSPASAGDPLLVHFHTNGLAGAWVGATNIGSSWQWIDGRTLDINSDLWHPDNPSGNGDCVEMLSFSKERRAYLNDNNCGATKPYVCETSPENTREKTGLIPILSQGPRNPFLSQGPHTPPTVGSQNLFRTRRLN